LKDYAAKPGKTWLPRSGSIAEFPNPPLHSASCSVRSPAVSPTRAASRLQISTDALAAYPEAVERAFGAEADYGQIVKTYSVGNLSKEAVSRYSPADVVKVEKHRIFGNPIKELVSTSHVEKQNHTLRMHCRRLTRLMNAFSKKLENFMAAVALNFAYYNFCKSHLAIRCTPAMAAGIEPSQWTVAELVERCGE